MPIKKSELYSSLWKSCDELRGGMDASQYKDYILVLLFVKYVSDKYAGQSDALIDVPKGGGFRDMVAAKWDKEIGDKMNKIIAKLAGAGENNLKGVIDQADFNDPAKLGTGKEMVQRLSNLVAIFENPDLDFSKNRAEGDDILGDAYEYLMRHFAIESGKSKGQFYTPAEVSRIMAKVIGIGQSKSPSQTIYDPTCGSGSLLLKAADETSVGVTIYGQEKDNATAGLARMNMILHDFDTAAIWQGNTLSAPHFKERDGRLKTFDFAVANPPFSDKAWGTGFNPDEDEFQRFEYGIPPAKNGDYAYLLHLLKSMKSTAKGAIILPHGVLFRGNAEANIRREIVRRGYIKSIIGLPPNLFYGASIPACILILDKEHASSRKGIYMIDASKGFIKDGNKNRLRAQDIHKIVDAFTHQAELPEYSRMVPMAEISDPNNDFNLNLPRYIDSTDREDLQDIDAHLRGGIPSRDIDGLDRYWQVLPSVRATLFKKGNRTGYTELKIAVEEVKTAIFSHEEFTTFNQFVTVQFEKWAQLSAPMLKGISKRDRPRELIKTISENLLDTFQKVPLLDPYDLYQHLMDFWTDTMQDDVYKLVEQGWKVVVDGEPDRDLIPVNLMIARYFKEESIVIGKLEADRDALVRKMEELNEEHGGEEGPLADAKTDKGKFNSKSVKDRLRAITGDKDAVEECEILRDYQRLMEEESDAEKKWKNAQKELDAIVAAKYNKLTQEEVKTLVVDDKWLSTLAIAMQSELDRASQALAGRIRELAERYVTPLPQLIDEVALLAARVDDHLKKMGAVWK